jgi:hypothetical protein
MQGLLPRQREGMSDLRRIQQTSSIRSGKVSRLYPGIQEAGESVLAKKKQPHNYSFAEAGKQRGSSVQGNG